MTADLSRELRVAEAAVLRAALLTRKVQSSVSGIAKEDKSPVTVADFAAQALIISALHAAFPADKFVGEEDAAAKRADVDLATRVYQLVSSAPSVAGPEPGSRLASPDSVEDMLQLIDLGGKGKGGLGDGRFWVLDPVDGTKTFLQGRQYAISLALIDGATGREMLGVLACPNLKITSGGHVDEDSVAEDGLGIMLSAVRGQGARVRYLDGISEKKTLELPDPQPIPRLIAPENTRDLRFVDCQDSKATRHAVTRELAAELGAHYPGTEVWSSHVRYAAMIIGGGDVLVRVPAGGGFKTCIWDHAGAQLIFTEAGGKITDLDGRPIDFGAGREISNNRGMVVARGEELHRRVLESVQQLLAAGV